ncbi:MAG TPA: hypothetical protein EYH57_06880 [Sulfurovum sp.]|nr:hypothetical protein [Sulfurovum sp.]
MTKILILTALLGTTLFANMATSAVKHDMKHETKDAKHDLKKKTDLDVNKKIKKEKHKLERKAIKAVL